MQDLSTIESVHARRAGFLRDVASISERALRSVARDPEVTIPALIIPVFFFLLNVGALENLAKEIPGLNYKAFQLPVAVLFAVTGISRAVTVVTDIQSGYFDRLVIMPVNRLAVLLGLMVADFTLVVALTLPVVAMATLSAFASRLGLLASSYSCSWAACGASYSLASRMLLP